MLSVDALSFSCVLCSRVVTCGRHSGVTVEAHFTRVPSGQILAESLDLTRINSEPIAGSIHSLKTRRNRKDAGTVFSFDVLFLLIRSITILM